MPEELPLGRSFIELSHQELRCVRRGSGDKARKGFVGARVVLGRDGLARSAKGEAEVVDPCGDQEAAHDAAGHEGGKRDPKRHAEAQPAAGDTRGGLPPKVIRQVAAERGAHGGSHLPVKGSQQIMIEQDCARKTRPASERLQPLKVNCS